MLTFNTEKYKDLAPLLLRVGVGLIFIVAGWGKLNGIDGTAEFFGNIGIPLPAIMAWVVAIVEFVGGIMVLVGYRIQLPALLLAIITTKLGGDEVFRAMRLDLMLMLVSLALVFNGSGSYSADSVLGKKES